MAQQRCIWSCLYNTGNDPNNPAYDRCVARNCNAGSAPAAVPQQTDPTRVWQQGRDAQGMPYAGVDLPGRAGSAGLYFFCAPGQLRFALIGLDGGARPMLVTIDGQTFAAPFSAIGPSGWPELPIFRGSPFLDALRAGSSATLTDQSGSISFAVSLSGSRRALGEVIASCAAF